MLRMVLLVAGVLIAGCSGDGDADRMARPDVYDPEQQQAPADAGGGASPYGAPAQPGYAPAPRGSGGPGRGLPPGALHMEPAVVVDASGFERPLAASTLFIPHGWRTQGGVFWGQEFLCTNGYNFSWSATSPDGLLTVAILPQEKWESNNYGAPPSTPGCQSAPYTNVRQYLEAVAQRLRPGVRSLDYRPREDIQREFSQYATATPMPMGETRTWPEAGELLVAFNENGRDMRGTVAAVVVFSVMRTNPGSGLQEMTVLNATAFPGWATSAPNGQLNLAFFEAIRRSIKANPQWLQRIGNHNAAIGRVALEESRKRSEMIMRSNEEISRIRQEAWSSHQESADRRAREFGELLRGVETYRDADAPTGQVELSHHYDHAWRLNDGTYVLTNDPNFEPWRDLQVEGRQLEAVR